MVVGEVWLWEVCVLLLGLNLGSMWPIAEGVWSWLSGPARVPFHSVHVSYLASRNLRG